MESPAEARWPVADWTNSGRVVEEVGVQGSRGDAILEVRRRSGLTWEMLASLFGVDRRSVHLWASGRAMNAPNAERLGRVLAAVRRFDRGSPTLTKAWLFSPGRSGRTPLDLLREGRFDEIDMPGSAVAAPRPPPLSSAAKKARAPQRPETLVGARTDRVHLEKGKLISAMPLDSSKPK